MKIRYRDFGVYLLVIVMTIAMLSSFGTSEKNGWVYFTFILIGAISFWGIVNTKLNISFRRNMNIFSYLFFFLAPWQQYSVGVSLWKNNGLRLLYNDELYIKTNIIIIISLFFYNIFSLKFEERFFSIDEKKQYVIILGKQSRIFVSMISFASLFLFLFSRKLRGLHNLSSMGEQIVNIIMFFPVCCLFLLVMAYPGWKQLVKRYSFWIVVLVIMIIFYPLSGTLARYLLFGTYIAILCMWFSNSKYKSTYFFIIFIGICFAFTGTRHLTNISNLTMILDFCHVDFDAHQILMTMVAYTDKEGIVFCKNIISALAFLIPRTVWQGKMINSGGIAVRYYGSWFTNVSAPLVGELYFALGWGGIILGAISLAYIFSKVDSWYNESNLFKKGTYCIFAGMAIYICRGSLLASMAYSLGLVLACYFISKIVQVKIMQQ